MALTRQQTAALHVAKKQLGLDDAAYRAILFGAACVTSAKDLDGFGFELVIQCFTELGWKPRMRSPFHGFRAGMASPSQLALIRALWGEYTGGAGTERGLGTWLQRQFRISDTRFITAELAPKVITALRAMAKQRRPECTSA